MIGDTIDDVVRNSRPSFPKSASIAPLLDALLAVVYNGFGLSFVDT